MPRISVDIPPGLNSDDTTFAAAPAWADGSNCRFRLGRPQTIGGFESIIATALTGVCRAVMSWTDSSSTNVLNIAFGTHSKLQLFQGGMLYDITPSSGFTAGQIDGTGSTGYGTGAYGIGTYGSPSATDYFPLTWSLAAWGQKLVASPRNQSLFEWSNVTGTPAAVIANAPDNITYMVVSPQFQVFALGCNEEVSGTFNAKCIRHSATRDNTGWTTGLGANDTSREYILPGGGRLVAGRVCGRNLLVWSNHELWLGTYVGSVAQIWRFDKVGDKCGLIGPGAAVVVGSSAFWISPDRQFHRYTLGGAVAVIPCPIREAIADNLAASQGDKIIASSIAEFSEIRFDYPDSRDGYENSRYVALCIEGPDAGSWYKGVMARTAMVDAGPSNYPIGVTYGGMIYWHEKGNSADGAAFSGFIESADFYLDVNGSTLVRQFRPDIANQAGAFTLDLYTRAFPQGDVTHYGPYTLAPSTDQVDLKASGALIRVRFSFDSRPAQGRLGVLVFDVKPRGRR